MYPKFADNAKKCICFQLADRAGPPHGFNNQAGRRPRCGSNTTGGYWNGTRGKKQTVVVKLKAPAGIGFVYSRPGPMRAAPPHGILEFTEEDAFPQPDEPAID